MRTPAFIQKSLQLRAVAICASFLLMVCPSLAQPQTQLDAIGLVETFTDVTVNFETPLGVTLPVRFHGDRSLSGNSGAIARHLGSERDRGRWWVEGPRLCQKWNVWFDGNTNCVEIFRSGDQITWKGRDGKSGRGQIVRRVLVTKQQRLRLPAPSALGARVPKMRSLGDVQTDKTIGRYSQPLRETGQSYQVARSRRGQSIQVVAYPSQSSQVLGQVDVATRELRGWGQCANGWCPVVFRGQHGWIEQKFLKRSAPRAMPSHLGPGLFYRVTKVKSWDVLNVRRQPNMSAALVGQLAPHAQNIRLIGVCRGLWCPIMVRGQRGWVNSHYLAIQ
ncbi:MAG: SH3 domain-containing protein [Pseudomonadota bacterium]